jgi:hypothetical protein
MSAAANLRTPSKMGGVEGAGRVFLDRVQVDQAGEVETAQQGAAGGHGVASRRFTGALSCVDMLENSVLRSPTSDLLPLPCAFAPSRPARLRGPSMGCNRKHPHPNIHLVQLPPSLFP